MPLVRNDFALAENLATLPRSDQVALFPWRGSRVVQYQVVVDVARFEGSTGRDLVLDARWRIQGSNGTELVTGSTTLNETTGGPGYIALVAEISQALGRLSRDVATALKEHL